MISLQSFDIFVLGRVVRLLASALLLVLVFGCERASVRQGSNGRISLNESKITDACCLAEIPKLGIVVAGVEARTDNKTWKPRIALYTDRPEPVWKNEIESPQPNAIFAIATTGYGFVLVGNIRIEKTRRAQGWAGGFDAYGKRVWQYTFDGATTWSLARSVVCSSDSSCVIVGESTTSKDDDRPTTVWAARFGPTGNLIWQRDLRLFAGPEARFNVCCVVQTSDGLYVIGGDTYLQDSVSPQALVIWMDPTGEVVWKRTLGGLGRFTFRARSLSPSDDGGVLVAGGFERDDFTNLDWRDWLVYFDAAGKIAWETFVEQDGVTTLYIATALTSRKTFVVALKGLSMNEGSTDILIREIDKRGNVLNQRLIPGGDELGPRGLLADRSGRTVVLGKTKPEGTAEGIPFVEILQR